MMESSAQSICRIMERHNIQVRKLDISSFDAIKNFWRITEESIISVSNYLKISCMGVYAPWPIDYDDTPNDLMLMGNSKCEDLEECISFKKVVMYDESTFLSREEINGQLYNEYLAIPSIAQEITLVIGLSFPARLDNQRRAVMIESISQFGLLLSNTFCTFVSVVKESNASAIFRLYRHELSHLLLSMGKLDRNSFKSMTDANDFLSSREHLNMLSYQMRLFMGGEIAISEEPIYIYERILYKWRNLLYEQFVSKGLHILMDHQEPWNDETPEIRTDEKALEQVVYNLLNNAYKYAYPNTNVYADFRVSPEGTKRISVTNYGIKVDESVDIYRLYSRGSNALESQEGTGIGLFVIKTIMDKFGGSISHRSEMISKYNVPMLHPFLSSSVEKKRYEHDAVYAEHQRLLDLGIEEEVLSNKKKSVPPRQVREMITQMTYRVTFEVEW